MEKSLVTTDEPVPNSAESVVGESEDALTEAASRLAAEVKALNKSAIKAAELRDELEKLDWRGIVNRRLIYVLIATVVVLVLVISVQVFTLYRQNSNIHRIDDLAQTQRAAICPIYGRFIQADTPQARELARQQGQNLEERAYYFKLIRQSYADLKCVELEDK